MCGRYYYSDKGADSKNEVLIAMMEKYYRGKYKTGEIFPGDTVPAVIEQSGRLVPVPATFGFPGFAGGKLLINARSETAAEKSAFSESLRQRRIILPANGFFEWSRDEKRAKYRFCVDSAPTIYLCGLYRLVDGTPHFVILTGRRAGAALSDGSRGGDGDHRHHMPDADADCGLKRPKTGGATPREEKRRREPRCTATVKKR